MKKILIIDDSPFIAMEIKNIVSEKGYEVICHARSGEEGIRKFSELRPDIVTIDIIMPGIDGIETAKGIKEICPDARIIMLSSLCDDDTMKELQEAQLHFVATKPIEKDKLIEILDLVSE